MNPQELQFLHLYRDLAVGVGIALLMGLERQWKMRGENSERHVAGLRTFGLFGIAGCAAGLALRMGQQWAAAAILVGGGALLVAGYVASWRQAESVGATSEAAGIAALALSAIAAAGNPAPAAALGVLAVVLLATRKSLHAGVAALNEKEIYSVVRFLVLAAVILPLLPDRGFGPYQAINPYSIGFMVVLLSGLSFAGYWATRLLGARHGLVLTAAFGGLVSSTAVTLALSRLSKTQELDPNASAAAITVATLVMFLRVLLLTAIIAPSLVMLIAWPVAAAFVGGAVATATLWWLSRRDSSEHLETSVGNPFELKPALFFAFILAAVTLGTRFAADRFGAGGVLVVSGITGLVDADSVIIANGRLASADARAVGAAAGGILLATAVNSISKAGIALVVAARPVGLRAAAALAVTVVAGGTGWLATA